ncbi:hypothetical protein F4677DRAFT_455224 [Hypoxylon crocopeplum]|nr:hypothetical protein F4677DRAFT_455224 [Hypoxylon crocopeplum]
MTPTSDRESEVRPSIERDNPTEMGRASESNKASEQAEHGDNKHEDTGDSSMLSERTDDTHDHTQAQAQTENSYLDHSESVDSYVHADDGGDSSSHHEATDEDVFSDKSPRSSMGSYDSIPEPGKAHKDFDNMTTGIRSPRISDISQYEREEFIPTARGTPRPPFRTPSDVRAMQMSSPPPSVLGSPRSIKRQFPTVSRLGTPNPSAHYSPKRMSTPSRFKERKEAPLVLLHVTLLPLRWVWGNLVNNLDTDEMNEQTKALRESWRILQDRISNIVNERGILLGHPQNDYEVLEERLLESLELPLRRRARILECGHYLGPANETSLAEDEESEDEWGSVRSRTDKHHWCGTCKDEIRYDSLGTGRIFRVNVYASNGLMKADAWAACWREMERVDVEFEPIVEPAVQEELARLAASHQERELTHQEEVEIAKEVAQQYEEQHQKEQDGFLNSHISASSPQPDPDPVRSPTSAEERRWRDEERLREIYGHTPPPPSSPQSPYREPSVHPHEDSYIPPSPSPPSPSQGTHEQREPPQRNYQNASLPELVLQSIRVLMQDRKNVVIFTLSIFVLMLALRNAPAPSEPPYEPVIHRMRDAPLMRRAQVVEAPQAQVKAPVIESFATTPNYGQPQPTLLAEPAAALPDHQDSSRVIHEQQRVRAVEHAGSAPGGSEQHEPDVESIIPSEPSNAVNYQHATKSDHTAAQSDHQEHVIVMQEQEEPKAESIIAAPSHGESEATSQPTEVQESSASTASVSTVYEPCNTPLDEIETETVTKKKVLRVVHTVTETEVEVATETVKVTAVESAMQSAPSVIAEEICTELSSLAVSETEISTVEPAAEIVP